MDRWIDDVDNVDGSMDDTGQVEAMGWALTDPSHEVRCVGVQATATILSRFWDLIPAEVSAAFLSRLFNDLAFDASHSKVRVAVVEGARTLVKNVATRETLATLLPQLKPLLNDTNEKVRVAMVKLLLLVRSMKSIRVYDVVSFEAVLARLVADRKRPRIRRAVMDLLVPACFPSGQKSTKEAAITRCAALNDANAAAASVFYSQLARHFAPERLGAFARLLFDTLSSWTAPSADADMSSAAEETPSRRRRGPTTGDQHAAGGADENAPPANEAETPQGKGKGKGKAAKKGKKAAATSEPEPEPEPKMELSIEAIRACAHALALIARTVQAMESSSEEAAKAVRSALEGCSVGALMASFRHGPTSGLTITQSGHSTGTVQSRDC